MRGSNLSFRYLVLTLVLLALVTSGCATNRENRWAMTGGAVVGGIALGAATAPGEERKELHAVYWGAILGLGASLIAQEIFSDSKEIERLKAENQKKDLQLDVIQNSKTVLLREGKGYFKSPSGEEFFSGDKAKWRLYQIDKWVKNGPNQLIHQDRMVEIVPIGESTK